MKKSIIALVCLAVLFALPFASAGFWQWITGSVGENAEDVNVTVGNTAPTIPLVFNESGGPAEGNPSYVAFKFTARDHDNATDLVDATAFAKFTKTDETERNITCTKVDGQDSGEYRNYTCNVTMWYWDAAGSWDVSASVSDLSAETATNTTTKMTYGELKAFKLTPSLLTWTGLKPSDTNKTANEHSTLNNTGNIVADVLINTTDLAGLIDDTKIIETVDFAILNLTGALVECTDGTSPQPGVFEPLKDINDADVVLQRGNLSSGEMVAKQKLYYCLPLVGAELTKQTYSTLKNGAWTVKIA